MKGWRHTTWSSKIEVSTSDAVYCHTQDIPFGVVLIPLQRYSKPHRLVKDNIKDGSIDFSQVPIHQALYRILAWWLVFANGPGDLGSISGQVILKTQKMVLDASLLNTQQYKVGIKDKVEESSHPRLRSPTLLISISVLY